MPTDAAKLSVSTTAAVDIAALERALERDAPAFDVEPWTVLPAQFHDDAGALRNTAEKRLMAAVLTDAVQVYLKHRPEPTARGDLLFREAERWIESRDRSWFLSFEYVCEVLGIAAMRLRTTLHARAGLDRNFRLALVAGRVRVARRRKLHL